MVTCPVVCSCFRGHYSRAPPGKEGAAFFAFRTVNTVSGNDLTAGNRNVRARWVPERRRRLDTHGRQGQRSHAVSPISAAGLKLQGARCGSGHPKAVHAGGPCWKRASRPKWKVEAQVMETECYVSNVTETSGGTLFTARDDRTRDASADKRDCWAPSSSLGGSLPLGESARVHPSGSAAGSGVLSPSDLDWNVRSVLLGHLAGGRGCLAHLLPGPR